MNSTLTTGAVAMTCAHTRVTRERTQVTRLLPITAPVPVPVWGSTLPAAGRLAAFGPATPKAYLGTAATTRMTIENSMDVAPPFRTGRPPA